MLQALFDFFYSIFVNNIDYDSSPFDILTGFSFQFGDNTITLDLYLPFLLSIISLIVIIVICCLFIYKIIKLVGGLIR